jgi:hypothetical protein
MLDPEIVIVKRERQFAAQESIELSRSHSRCRHAAI